MNKLLWNSKLCKSQYFTVLLVFLFTLVFASTSMAQFGSSPTKRYYLMGTLDGDPFQMDITFSDSSTGSSISGEYFFLNDGPRFKLMGDLMSDDANAIDTLWGMTTLSDSGESLDFFEFELINPRFHYDGPKSELDNVTLRGLWTSGAGSEAVPFEAYAVAEYVFLSMTNGDHIEIDMSYPYFLVEPWKSLNGLMTKSVPNMIDFFQEGQLEREASNLMGWGASDSVRIHYLSDSLISLEEAGWIYLGGAHGNSASISRNFSRDEGDWIELSISDFFDDGVDFASEMEENILLLLEQEDAAWVVDGTTTTIQEDDLYSVLVSPKGLDISFDPYHMGPYAQGHIGINLPFEYVGPILDEDGPLKEVISLSGFDSNDY